MGLFKGQDKKHKKVKKWIAGFELFENKPVVVQATFIETPKSFMLLEENSRNYREFRRLADRVTFRKDKPCHMALLYDTPEEAVKRLLISQEKEVRRAKIRLKEAQEEFDAISKAITCQTVKKVECTD